MKVGYLGIDQYGNRYKMDKHPRKELLAQFDRKRASKMYRDVKGGGSKHCGYIVAGHWIDVYEVHSWKS